ncbi:endonuclease [Flavobacterium sp. GT3R68]|uniref:endonuclease n=1 Tax=Flavobacterium sp. GT3R68 TaxID=2594437 RepID=UPI000F896EA9|nr:endonuclease [Flavobacterium sp. GT3R68]RTY90635.1 T9SS type A sorting domain-containing protein [Flavobacterium sp. GSN2]TRW89839.1 T9SS type A sorting domain-containing protein [Flavobacterium sp. GT3R68]
MFKKYVLLLTLLVSGLSYGQLVINELDPDTASTDVKEFVEIKSTTPNFSLDGYVVVFFNAGSTAPYSGTSSYYAIDLDGLVTDGNGNILIGNLQVSPAASLIFPQNTIQNGPDSVAIYLGNAINFPLATPASSTNLIDALAYSNGATTQPSTLMSIFGETVCYNENVNSLAASQSIQRKSDGTYEVKTPTPRTNNDGSGIIYNGIGTTFTPSAPLTEGQTMTITFTTDSNVTSDLNFSFTLNNSAFNSADYTGSLNVTIPNGTNTTSKVIQLLNDGVNEGDETMRITLGTVPSQYIILNNNIAVRVNDINFVVSPWGTPLNPTYGQVTSTAPAGYYSSLEGLAGAALKQALQDIIANPAVVHAHNYGDVYDILNVADQNPANSSQVWLMYVEQPRSKLDVQSDNSIVGKWNREHIYCQSRGGFTDGTSSTPDGINTWLPTDANDILTGHGDAHHIRAEDGQENSSRNERNYGVDYNGPVGSAGSWRGDVARGVFYMSVRYNALNVVNGNPPQNPDYYIGDLATLLTWNMSDPSDDFEMNRNNYIYTWQVNRNPFIDYPSLADYIWGANAGQPWFSALGTHDATDVRMVVYPNPAKDYITVSGVDEGLIEIYNLAGSKLFSSSFMGNTRLNINLASGLYLAKVISGEKTTIKKIIVK